ncbi:Uncharacterised protein [Streptococcus dysgalactiae subsp. dysgalactiae]|uniref:Lipoprotein n=1 Tax=Streptococcus dysgalactiae subsp. dysgalactiae TaxID=99822 RepID=A0A380JTQ9_STRDY|nr:hypothetical protein [Streptococcus dysgalactiae]SUN48779.1 Uncharacterised protein [Streptococcus dysgalactiae subsp. dysgalactiae]
MKINKTILVTVSFLFALFLVACGSNSNTSDNKLSGTYTFERDGIDGSDMGFEDEELTLHYELKVSEDKNILNIAVLSERGNNVRSLYSEKVTIDSDKHIISDSKGTKLDYTATENSVTIPDLAGNKDETVTLTK